MVCESERAAVHTSCAVLVEISSTICKDQAPACHQLAAVAAQHRRMRGSLGDDPDTSVARLVCVSISEKQNL